jgi:hypothetical protein
MTLLKLLEIKRRLVHRESLRSLDLAERMWIVRGEPEDEEELADLLEAVINHCMELGIRYAPILLKRKKALERGSWSPRRLQGGAASLDCESEPEPPSAIGARLAQVPASAEAPPVMPASAARSVAPEDSVPPALNGCARCLGRGLYTEEGLNRLCPCGAFLARVFEFVPVDPGQPAV